MLECNHQKEVPAVEVPRAAVEVHRHLVAEEAVQNPEVHPHQKVVELKVEHHLRVHKAVVHKVARGPSGLLYVADRTGCKIREFELIPGGARCTRAVDVGPGTKVRTTGSCWDIGFSLDGDYMYVADGSNFRVWIVALDSFEVLGSTSIHDEHENEVNQPIHYSLLHRFTVEANGDLLLAMVNAGVKRLKYLGVS